jgi:hypothetical protein
MEIPQFGLGRGGWSGSFGGAKAIAHSSRFASIRSLIWDNMQTGPSYISLLFCCFVVFYIFKFSFHRLSSTLCTNTSLESMLFALITLITCNWKLAIGQPSYSLKPNSWQSRHTKTVRSAKDIHNGNTNKMDMQLGGGYFHGRWISENRKHWEWWMEWPIKLPKLSPLIFQITYMKIDNNPLPKDFGTAGQANGRFSWIYCVI